MTLKRKLTYCVILTALIMIYPGPPAFALSPTPDCQGTLRAWKMDVSLKQYMRTHSCYCPSRNSRPVCTSKSTTRGAATPSMGGYGSSEDVAMEIWGSLVSSLFQAALAPPKVDRAQQQKLLRQQEEARKKQAALKKQAIEQWENLRDKEKTRMARQEAEKRERGRAVLAKMEGMGSDKLEPFPLETMRLEAMPMGAGVFDTSGLTSWQRLLCSAYFSSQALDAARSGNPEGARFMNVQADRVTVGEMTDVDCRLPGLQQLADVQRQNLKENNRMTQMVKLLPIVQEKVKHLQQIEMKLHEAKEGKKEAGMKLKEAESKAEEARVRAKSARTPEEKAEADDLARQALALKDEASARIEKAEQAEQEYEKLKETKMGELKDIQEKMNTGTANK